MYIMSLLIQNNQEGTGVLVKQINTGQKLGTDF